MRVTTRINETRPTGDLTSAFEYKRFEDGEHVVHEEDGRRLVVRAAGGAVTEWLAFDRDGREVQTVVIRTPLGNENDGTLARAKGYYKVCACYENGDRCWWVRWF